MNDDSELDKLEQLLRQAAADLRDGYPPTPPIAASVRRELESRRVKRVTPWRGRLIRAVALASVAFAALLLVSPDARQAVARFFGLETVRIQQVATLPAPAGTPAGQPAGDLAGRASLAEARVRAGFEVRLPAYPPDLDRPQVYFQDFGPDQQVILVYSEFSLYESDDIAYLKEVTQDTVISETFVSGERALWVSGGEHLVQVQGPNGAVLEARRPVTVNVLAWEADDVTYRLETALPFEEALRIAESIHATPQIVGLTTLADAQARARFTVRQPAYPTDLGPPSSVYFQALTQGFEGAQLVILIYPDFALYESEYTIYHKSIGQATTVRELTVGGRPALWLSGASHVVEMRSPSGEINIDFIRLVEGNVLAWEVGPVTYRLETKLSLEEALRIAESIDVGK